MREFSPSFSFKTLSMGLRPARVALLLPTADPDWRDTCLRSIEWASQVWGGSYFVCIPTDGDSIDKSFWHILNLYDPDYIRTYRKSLFDLRFARSEEYDLIIKQHVDTFLSQAPGADPTQARQHIEEQTGFITLSRLPSDELRLPALMRCPPPSQMEARGCHL